MYGASKYSHCPKAQRKQASVKKYRLRRKQARWKVQRRRFDRKVKRAIRRRDKALLRCQRIERRKGKRKAWWARGKARREGRRERRQDRRAARRGGAEGYDPYAEEIYDVEARGMVNGDEMYGDEMYGDEEETYRSGMGAMGGVGEGDYIKLIGGLVGLSLFIGLGIYVTNRMEGAQA